MLVLSVNLSAIFAGKSTSGIANRNLDHISRNCAANGRWAPGSVLVGYGRLVPPLEGAVPPQTRSKGLSQDGCQDRGNGLKPLN